jgi:hypothetical protein
MLEELLDRKGHPRRINMGRKFEQKAGRKENFQIGWGIRDG